MRRTTVMFLAVLGSIGLAFFTWDEAESATYEQVVDNSDKGRFAASKNWKTSDSGKGINGDDYRFALPADDAAHALFEVAIPSDGEYTVYVRWPDVPGLNESVPVGVETRYGTKWTEVNQRQDGGSWVRVGEYEMREDGDFPVRISRDADGKGNVAADAVKVVRVESYEEAPQGEPQDTDDVGIGSETFGDAASRKASGANGEDVIRYAATYKNTPYELTTGFCKTDKKMDCSCYTMHVFRKFGVKMLDWPKKQANEGRPVDKSNPSPGDLVYFKENGPSRPVSHVGIYAGNGYLWHASSYYGKVVKTEMKWLRGYAGARRLV